MREIKFQVVTDKGDFICNEWLDGDGWKHDHYSPLVANGTFNHEELGDGFLHELIRRQSTGFKDKNGVEIWENDIYLGSRSYMSSRGYKSKKYPKSIKVICVVKWSEFHGGWHPEEIGPIPEHREADEKVPYHYYNTSLGASDGICDWLEVIGNIYSNPELLKP